MSYPHLRPTSLGNSFPAPIKLPVPLDSSLPFVESADTAIDAALRSVPLPEGFTQRLSVLVGSITDEVSESVDYLGC
jgi:hypothetical protein